MNRKFKSRTYKESIRFLLILSLFFTSVQTLKAQNHVQKKIKVTGIVTDANGEPLVGVNVYDNGNPQHGVITDVDGMFTIDKIDKGDFLVFRYIGFTSKNVQIQDDWNLKIVLVSEITGLEEVVVTGYSKIEKHKLSSSVVSIKGEDVINLGASSVDKMLQGKIAGLVVMDNTSTPGAAPKIRVRGSSSITGNREPIWVVDGIIVEDPVPLKASELNSADNVNLIGNAISSINPSDIERIDVLKDASATAIYGTKAANGVIVITTKKGKQGKLNINYSTSVSVHERPSYNGLNLMNSSERIEVSEEIYRRGLSYQQQVAPIAYEGALYDLWNKKIDYNEFNNRVNKMKRMNTDWFDILFRNSISNKHSLSISGANEKTNYYFSAGYVNDKGVVKGEDYTRFNALMKVGHKINEKLKVNIQLRSSLEDKEYLHSSIDAYHYAYNTSRAMPCYYENGDLAYYYGRPGLLTSILKYNIKNEINNSQRNINSSSLNFSARVEYDIAKWLNFESTLGINHSNTDQNSWANEKTYYIAQKRKVDLENWDNNDPKLKEESILPYGGLYNSSVTKQFSYTLRNALNLRKSSNKHDFNVMLGTEIRSTKYDGLSSRKTGYIHDKGRQFIYIDPAEYPKYGAYLLENPDRLTDRLTNFVSYYVTATYTYDRRYSFNFNRRADGSNKFGQAPENKFLPVWSTSVRWNGHNESFLKDYTWLDSFVFRASYGVQGNVHPDMSPSIIARQDGIDSKSLEYRSRITTLPNPNLRWEKTTSYNFGLDFGIFNNFLTGTFELYKKKGEDQIVSRRVSSITGRDVLSINRGNIENKGVELALNANLISKQDLSWSLGFAAYKNENKVTKANEKDGYTYYDYIMGRAILPGRPVDGFYSYRFGGLDENGLPTFEGIDPKDGATKEERFEKMFDYSGSRVAKINGSFNTYVRYKRLSMNMFWSYSLGRKIRLNSMYSNSGQKLPKPDQNMSADFVNRWKKPGDENHTDIPTLSSDPLSISSYGYYEEYIGKNFWQMYNYSDIRVVKGDYLRLSTLSFRYDLGKNICNKMGVSKVTLKTEGSNLLLIADDKLHGQDPDHVSFGNGTTPITPTYTFGLEVNF